MKVLDARLGASHGESSAKLGPLTQIVGRSAQEMADGLMAAVLDFRRGAPRDDIAILVMKMAEEVGTAS